MSYDFNGDSNKGDDKDRTMMLGLPLGKDGIGALFRRSRSRIASRRMDVLMSEGGLRKALRIETPHEAVEQELQRFGGFRGSAGLEVTPCVLNPEPP